MSAVTKEIVLARREAWIKNLLDTARFPRGVKYLCRAGKYCVWGVACETALCGDPAICSRGGLGDTKTYDGCVSFPPWMISQYFGFERVTVLAYANDQDTPLTKLGQMIRDEPIFIGRPHDYRRH